MKNRIFYLDKLRVIAIFSVIVIHVSATMFYSTSVKTLDWQVMNFFDSLTRFAVPLFVMMSGALLLNSNKEYSIKELYRKKIFRLIIAFLFWSLIYAMYHFFIDNASLKVSIINFIEGEYHQWFIFMIIILYIMIPILKVVIKDKKVTEYFLIISFIFTCVVPCLTYFPAIGDNINGIINKSYINFFTGYTFYFILGHYLNTYHIKTKHKNILYIVAILAIIFTVIGSSLISIIYEKPISILYNYFFINTSVVAMAIFIYAKDYLNKKTHPFISKLSNLSFGIYLVHVLILFIFQKIGFVSTLFNPLLSIPIISIACFFISACIILIIKKFSKIADYIT